MKITCNNTLRHAQSITHAFYFFLVLKNRGKIFPVLDLLFFFWWGRTNTQQLSLIFVVFCPSPSTKSNSQMYRMVTWPWPNTHINIFVSTKFFRTWPYAIARNLGFIWKGKDSVQSCMCTENVRWWKNWQNTQCHLRINKFHIRTCLK